MKIAVISDLHIGDANERIRDIAVRDNFLKVLIDIKERKVDLLIINGDLVDNPLNKEAYLWIKTHLQALGIPYLVVAGNHDDPQIITRVFNIKSQSEWPHGGRYKIDDINFICLDSSSSVIDSQQLKMLNQELDAAVEFTVLVMHHPPCLMGCTYMDRKYPLKNPDRLSKVIQNRAQLKLILCGHYHTDRMVVQDGLPILITPSTMMQLDSHCDFSRVQSYQAGWRYIEIAGKSIRTETRFL